MKNFTWNIIQINKLLETGDAMLKIWVGHHKALDMHNTEEVFPQDLHEILKRLLQNFMKILRKCFFVHHKDFSVEKWLFFLCRSSGKRHSLHKKHTHLCSRRFKSDKDITIHIMYVCLNTIPYSIYSSDQSFINLLINY